MSGYLDEVAESDATGRVAEIYHEIRTVFGIPFVSLIYRHLAVTPELLERTWGGLRLLLDSAESERAAAELADSAAPHVVAIPRQALGAIGVEASEFMAISATLDAYTRANTRNLLGMTALLQRPRTTRGARRRPSESRRERSPGVLLPMSDLRDLEPPVRALLDAMSPSITGDEPPIVVPSLWRHFGHRPALLALLWTVLRGPLLSESMSRYADELTQSAKRRVKCVGAVDVSLDPVHLRAIERFRNSMARMVICGLMMRKALVEGDSL